MPSLAHARLLEPTSKSTQPAALDTITTAVSNSAVFDLDPLFKLDTVMVVRAGMTRLDGNDARPCSQHGNELSSTGCLSWGTVLVQASVGGGTKVEDRTSH
jgi:hypothetical protein